MAQADNTELVDSFEQFYRSYYRDEIGQLAQRYPNEQRSLYVDWQDLYRYDPDLADDYLSKPDQLREYAEEALRLYDLPVDVSLGQAHVRIRNLPETTEIREIRSRHVNNLVSVRGIVRKATDVRPKIEEAAFECQRCGTLTRVPQSSGNFQEPHECQGCERQGPFQINFDQSEFVDSQKIRVQESPEGLRGGETPQAIDVHVEDDITGEVTPGDHVAATGVLNLEQQGSQQEKSAVFDVYMDGVSVEVEEEQFEDMEITEEDKQAIVSLSNEPDIYERMVGSIAPSIYGYEQEKLAMILQLFSGVTKHLPDESRIRGDLHMLLIGDPGTGKCVTGDTRVTLADGTQRPIREIVESQLDDPKPVDDGVYQEVDIPLPSMDDDGELVHKRATKVWKREAPERMYRIRTATGTELEVTPSHPLFVQSDNGFAAVPAEDLRDGDFVAVPDTLPTAGDDTITTSYRRAKSNNAVRLDLPEEWTAKLARLVGYIIAEGYVERRDDNTGHVFVTNNDREILDDVSDALNALGLNYTERRSHPGKSAKEIYCSSSEFVTFLENLEPSILESSADQRVPDAVMSATKATKAEFLRAYVDAEGHVSATQRELAVASASEELLRDVRSLLLSVGITSQQFERANGSYRLRVSGEQFQRYRERVGFVTDRKAKAAREVDEGETNTNRDVIPEVGDDLRRVRERLRLTQFDCGIPRPTYQHYERGDRNPSRESLREVVSRFEERLNELRDLQESVESGNWTAVETARQLLGLSQTELADGIGVCQRSVSLYEQGEVAPDGGRVTDAKQVVQDRIDDALAAASDVEALRSLVTGDVRWDCIASIQCVEPEEDWVYDLEVADTHNYLTNNVVSHNSQLLSYIQNIAPRSVYTSGKGSSSAGLCVTGDTMIHTDDGYRPIRDIVTESLPDPVDTETGVGGAIDVRTFDRNAGEMTDATTSHLWRMPEKPCRRIETNHGKELEASVNTPVLTCGADGIEWRQISEIEAGDHVAVPRYGDLDRSEVRVREFLELTSEKVQLAEGSVTFLRESLREEFGTLRDAAAALDLSEDFIYCHLKNRHVPLEKLDRMLDAVGATRADVQFDRLMVRHGDSITIPETFDEDLMYLLGLVFGDGDISLDRRGGNRGMVRISNGNETLLERAADIFDEKFDKRPEVERQADKVPCIRVNSATIARLFSNAGMETPKEDLALAPELTVAEHGDAFLRGLMDADGSVSVRDAGGSSVLLSTISDELARQVQLMLETYGVRARTRERDRRGSYELDDGYTIESKHVQQFVEMYGADIDRYADAIGFASREKRQALERITADERRQRERLPIGSTLAAVEGETGQYYQNVHRGDDPGRAWARSMLEDIDLGPVETEVRETVDADLRWDEVVAAVDTGRKEVFDLTVPDTNNFVGNGVVTHNTAAAVRDDFGDGQQWTLEAGALVLADKGVAAIDELDKMAADDRSAMHEALEQQKISVSKAGINATLKSRCSLLGAANPKYGRFDQYESIGEQIDLEPALISRFDLIFTVTDQPDEEEDRNLAEHILTTNYAGELNTQRSEMASPDVTQAEVDEVTEEVDPEIEAELLRKYVAYAKQNCHPRMTDAAREAIRDFYVDLRAKGQDEDAPVPVTARKLEALVRLAEASARVRLSDTVEHEDAERVIEIVRSCLQDIGVDPETGQFDADVVETGTSKTQRDRIRNIKQLISDIEEEYDEGAPVDVVLDRADEIGMDHSKAEHEIEKLKQQGEVYEPQTDHLRTT
ncbi:LAGLIDADG family homing endonuclease [Halostella salina]|uniref:LAGLIDADG family homing endonuclease n=1 Tax=Halostella salina TaxID=1547897 RepID=UPI000EF774C4|nr:LAGLIDADG family homing endonuclease [Halostella salina]